MQSRSQQIVAAARVLIVGWVFSVGWYFFVGRHGPSWGYAVIDAGLAAYFWRASKGRWFPVPLFYLHAFLIAHYLYATIFQTSPWWMIAFVNRLFEAAILYVIGCAVFRIVRLRRKKRMLRIDKD